MPRKTTGAEKGRWYKRVRMRMRDTTRTRVFLDFAEEAEALALHDVTPRPTKRGDCVDGPRPCPWFGCRYHLGLDVNVRSGNIAVDEDILDGKCETCALDVAERGPSTLQTVGDILKLTRERARQIEQSGVKRIASSRQAADVHAIAMHVAQLRDAKEATMPEAPPLFSERERKTNRQLSILAGPANPWPVLNRKQRRQAGGVDVELLALGGAIVLMFACAFVIMAIAYATSEPVITINTVLEVYRGYH